MALKPGEVELRVNVPRRFVDLIDAVSLAHRTSRTEEVIALLERWAREIEHQASLVQRLTRGNPREGA